MADSSGTADTIESKTIMLADSVRCLEKSIADQEEKQREMHEELNGEEGVLDDVETMKQIIGEIQADLSTERDRRKTEMTQLRTLTAVMVKQSQQIDSLQSEIEVLKGRSMRDNVLVHNVPEVEKDDAGLFQIVQDRLSRVGVDLDPHSIVRMHRMGRKEDSRQGGKHRLIVIQINDPYIIAQMIKAQKPFKHRTLQDAYLTPQHTDHVRAKRREMNEIADKMKEKSPKAKIRLSHTSLYVNGQLVKPTLETPSIKTILCLEDSEKEDLIRTQFHSLTPVLENDSNFRIRATRVKTVNDVRQAYKAMLLDPDSLSATHNVCGYKLQSGSCGYADDGDYGIGRKIVQVLDDAGSSCSDLAVFITRHSGGGKLGTKRFDIVTDLTKKVMQMMLTKNKQSHGEMNKEIQVHREPTEKTVTSTPEASIMPDTQTTSASESSSHRKPTEKPVTSTPEASTMPDTQTASSYKHITHNRFDALRTLVHAEVHREDESSDEEVRTTDELNVQCYQKDPLNQKNQIVTQENHVSGLDISMWDAEDGEFY